MIHSIVKVCIQNVWFITMLCFQLLWVTFQTKKSVSSLLVQHLSESHTEAIVRVQQIVTYTIAESTKETKVGIVILMLELLQSANSHISG